MKLPDLLGDLLLPLHCTCFVCDGETEIGEDLLCGACRAQLKFCSSSICRAPLDGYTAGLLYEGIARDMVHGLKYGRKTRFARTLAHYIRIPAEWRFDAVVPVPLHWLRRHLRGYNQSELLAEMLCPRLDAPLCADLLRRTRHTRTQTRLAADARRKNVRNAFSADNKVKGMSILLIDDVSTTHSTLLACAKALKKAGAARVYAATACTVFE